MNFYRMYSDGSYFDNNRIGVSTCIIFNSTGVERAFKCQCTGYNSFYYELLPIVLGLESIEKDNLFLVSVKTDCLQVVRLARRLMKNGIEEILNKSKNEHHDIIIRFYEQLLRKPTRFYKVSRRQRYIQICHDVCRGKMR